MGLFIFLWSLLFVIPGIVKAYSYRMIPYLMAEDSNLSFFEAKDLSRRMMDGHKWNTFILDLSFIPWHILSFLTAGIVGVLYVVPYVEYTDVELYRVLRQTIPGPYYNESYANASRDFRSGAYDDSEVNYSNGSESTYNTYDTENRSDDSNEY